MFQEKNNSFSYCLIIMMQHRINKRAEWPRWLPQIKYVETINIYKNYNSVWIKD